MGPFSASSDDDNEAAHRDEALNDLTIIQAQAQLMMRRIQAGKPIDPDDTYRRLRVVTDAVQRLTEGHRNDRPTNRLRRG